jgi:hypothetical protein
MRRFAFGSSLVSPLLSTTIAATIAATIAVMVVACADLKSASVASEAGPGAVDPGDGGPADLGDGGGTPANPDGGGVKVTVDTLVTGRNRLGARSIVSYRPWRSGIAVSNGQVYWVESGTAPGLYSSSAALPCTADFCVTKVATFARPSAFTASPTHVYVADTTVIKRFAFGTTAAETVVSSNMEVDNLATAGTRVFWTSGDDSAMNATVVGGTTNTPINSNGTPISMAVAGDQLFWAGVDISGQNGAMQAVGTDGTGAREVNRFSAGFHTMAGNATFLYYGKDDPGSIHRITLNSGHDEVLDKDALGVTDFAIDATHAYWVEPGDGDFTNGRVRRIAHDSTTAETLAVGIALPVAIAVSGKTVFVASAGTKTAAYADGKILRLTLAE